MYSILAKATLLAAAIAATFRVLPSTSIMPKRETRIRVACVGDSITSHGCASTKNMTYVAQLQQLLGEDKYEVTNYGVSGTTMLKNGYCASNAKDCGGNCSYWKTVKYQAAIDANPDIVTIMLGTNDAKGCNWYGPPNGSPGELGIEYRSAYLDMVSRFHSLPSKPKVFVVIPPPLTNPPTHPEKPPPYNMKKHVLNELIPHMVPTIAEETDAEGVIDIWTALGGEEKYEDVEMTCDGCHPKDKAMTIIAKTIAQAITASDTEVKQQRTTKTATSVE